MKKTALTIIAGFMAVCSYAQTAYDALLFSENNYEGTARTVAMGNAFTALGGDLGSIGLNPAGSAVAGYSQITITPGLTFTANTTQGVMPPSGRYGDLPYFQKKTKSGMTSFNLPNLGATLNFDTGRKSGLKNFTIGFLYNQTASFDEDVFARGTNDLTSFMGSMAYDATMAGFTGTELNKNGAYDYFPWKEVVGYQSGMISTIDYDDLFIGASENSDFLPGGNLDQTYGRRVEGGKYDYVFNIGANWSDFIYFGANLGISSLDYSYDEYFKEAAHEPALFETGFIDMKYRYIYAASGTGYYGKFGVIVTPGGGLRIGAAIQTPTANRIAEEWYHEGETSFTDASYNGYAESPLGRGEYTMVSPYRANFGLAYAIGRFGVISADYEFSDYSLMKYRTSDYDRDYFEDVNDQIRENFTVSHMLRIGAEIKPVPEFAIRAGYDLATSPERIVYESKGASAIKTQNAAFGLGYSSKKSFFADFAVRKTFLADEYFMPYADYNFDEDGFVVNDLYSPEIRNQRGLWKVSLTFGWRF